MILQLKSRSAKGYLAIQPLWATPRLVTRFSLIFLVDEFFVVLFLVLLEEMRK